MSGVVVVLEDSPGRVERMRLGSALPVRVFARVVDLLEWLREPPERVRLISLDHHLATRADGSGLQAARALAAGAPICPVLLHSSDTVAAGAAAEVLRDAGWQAEQAPFEAGGWSARVARLLAAE